MLHSKLMPTCIISQLYTTKSINERDCTRTFSNLQQKIIVECHLLTLTPSNRMDRPEGSADGYRGAMLLENPNFVVEFCRMIYSSSASRAFVL